MLIIYGPFWKFLLHFLRGKQTFLTAGVTLFFLKFVECWNLPSCKSFLRANCNARCWIVGGFLNNFIYETVPKKVGKSKFSSFWYEKILEKHFTVSLWLLHGPMNVFSSKFVPRIYEVRGRFVYYKEKFILRILPRDLESKHSKTNYWQKLMYTALIACTLRSSILHNIYTTGNEGHIILQRRRRKERSANMPRLCKLFTCLTLLLFMIRSSIGQCALKTCEKESLNLATDTKHNLFLQGYVLETLSFSSWKDCYFFCVKNCQCLSFNFYEASNKTSNCKLNDANTKIVSEALTAKEGVTYYEPVRKYPGKEVCMALNFIEWIICVLNFR